MAKFDVYIYAVVRVRLCDIEAENHDQAIANALESAELYSRFQDRQDRAGIDQEFDEREVGFVVLPLRPDGAYRGEYSHTESGYYVDAEHVALTKEKLKNGYQLYFSQEYREYLNRRKKKHRNKSPSS